MTNVPKRLRPAPLETRRRILAAAATVIAAEGFAGATMQMIAAQIGLSKGALAYHFPTKRLFLLGFLEIAEVRLTELAETARLVHPKGGRDALDAFVRLVVDEANLEPVVETAIFLCLLDPSARATTDIAPFARAWSEALALVLGNEQGAQRTKDVLAAILGAEAISQIDGTRDARLFLHLTQSLGVLSASD